jgi:hypothetical protein
METMSEFIVFNVGDEIVRVNNGVPYASIGYKTTVLNGNMFKDEDSDDITAIIIGYWELVEPKWTIYNNTLPWSQLNDEKKGKLLLAAHQKQLFSGFGLKVPDFAFVNSVYKVEEVTKPEPTMEELFIDDWKEIIGCRVDINFVNNFIAKGWTKSCK